MPHLGARLAAVLDVLSSGPCREGSCLPPFLRHCAKQVSTRVAPLHALKGTVLKELGRDGKAKAAPL